MSSKSIFLIAALALLAAPLSATSTEKLKNDKVQVLEDTLAPGESESIAGNHPSVLVFFSGQNAEFAFANGQKKHQSVARGDTVAEPAELTRMTNTGSSPLHLVRVEFLTAGSDEIWGRAGMPPNYKLLFEDRYSRTYDIRIAAHEKEQRHTHHARVVVCLSGAKLEHILEDGRTQPSTLETGEIAWRPGQTHIGHNLGDTNLWVIAIEPK